MEQMTKSNQEAKDSIRRSLDTSLRNSCLSSADENYWSYMRLNGTEKDDGTISADQRFWDNASKSKKEAQDLCFKKYPID